MAFIPPSKPGQEFKSPARGERLQRFMADQGVASRRACEQLIREGRVTVNGIKVHVLPIFVDPSRDHVQIDGRGLGGGDERGTRGRNKHEYVMLYKPARTICAAKDEPGLERTTVMDLVKHHSGKRLFPVGRLDYETTGLLLLTDDGELTNRLTHPRYNVPKVYEVVVKDSMTSGAFDLLKKELRKFEKQAARRQAKDEGPAEVTPVEVELIAKDAEKTLLRITIRESRNREIRQMIAAAGLTVRKVERVAVGPLELSGVRLGSWRDLEPAEVKALYKASEQGMPEKTPRQLAKATRPMGSFRPGTTRRPSRPMNPVDRDREGDEVETKSSFVAPAAKDRKPAALAPKPAYKPAAKAPSKTTPNDGPKAKTILPVHDEGRRKGPRTIAPRQY